MDPNKKRDIYCTDCGVRTCIRCSADADGTLPDYCMSKRFEAIREEAREESRKPENLKIMQGFLKINPTGLHGGQATRVEMLMGLFRSVGAKKIGIATCYGLLNEARTFSRILRANGFDVYGINCKVGTMDKADLDVPPEEDPYPGESSCNPILQAKILNRFRTDYNVIVGLCVGHDALFSKYSEAPVSTLVVKDFALGHNSVACLYQADSYYKGLLEKD